MAATQTDFVPATSHLKRSVGFWGLTFVSLGSIIGSGWLLGALNAVKVAGPASLISWVLAAVPHPQPAPLRHRLAGAVLDLAVADRHDDHRPDRPLRDRVAEAAAELD